MSPPWFGAINQTFKFTLYDEIMYEKKQLWEGVCLTFEIFGILLGSIVLLFLVMGTVFQVSSLCTRWSLASKKEKKGCWKNLKPPLKTKVKQLRKGDISGSSCHQWWNFIGQLTDGRGQGASWLLLGTIASLHAIWTGSLPAWRDWRELCPRKSKP